MTTPNIGLVLSGGGYRGIAHIGVIKLLEELEIPITHVAGTSAGAVIGAFYAAGYSADQILDFLIRTNIFSWRNYAFRKAGVLDPMKFYSAFLEYFPHNRFEQLEKELFISKTNLETGHNEVVHKGELITNLLASAALPLMFAPVEIDGTLYADGGIINNFPSANLQDHCTTLIGVYVNPLASVPKNKLTSSLAILERALHIGVVQKSMSQFDLCEVMIVPEALNNYSLLDRIHKKEIFEIGYQAAAAHKEELKRLVLGINTMKKSIF